MGDSEESARALEAETDGFDGFEGSEQVADIAGTPSALLLSPSL